MKTDRFQKKQQNSELADYECGHKLRRYEHTPEVLQIELTDRCNGACIMCSHYYKGNRQACDLKDGILERIEPLLDHCRMVLLNGYGEPFISGKYRQCMNMLRRHGVKAFVTTNLSVFHKEMEVDVEEDFAQINISCHGCSKEDYERISLGLSFERFCENLKRITLLKNCPPISLSVVAMASNIEKASDFIRFAKEYGITDVRFGRLGINSFIGNVEQDLIHYPQVAAEAFRKAEKLAKEAGIHIVYPENYREVGVNPEDMRKQKRELEQLEFKYTKEYQKQVRQKYREELARRAHVRPTHEAFDTGIKVEGICDWVGKGLYIDKDGECYPCCEIKEVSYGNILEESLENILNGEKAAAVRDIFYDGRLPYFCMSCPFVTNQELRMLKVEKKPERYRALDYLCIGEQDEE